jgi:hypothetical protein
MAFGSSPSRKVREGTLVIEFDTNLQVSQGQESC